jgi:hypothetical protein
MTADYTTQVQELLEQAEEIEDGASRIALVEEAIRIADTHGDVTLGFTARRELVEAGTFFGEADKALVAFTWCLGQCDRSPEEFDEEELLWQYKWVVNNLAEFPQLSRQQILEVLDDMTRRYRKVGSGLRAVYKIRCNIARDMGDRDEARHWQREWRDAPRDALTDCAACERDDQIAYMLYASKDERALELATPILRGAMRCAEIPHHTLARVLLPLVRLGRVPVAMACHQQGYRLISRNRDFIGEMASHVNFLGLTGNLSRGVQLVEKHVPWALETPELGKRFQFYLSARFVLGQLRDAGTSSAQLRLPSTFPAYQESGRYEVPALAGWFDTAVRELAARFDTRNGNDWFARQIGENDKLKELVTSFPIPSSTRQAEE